MTHEHELPVSDVSSTPKGSFFIILSILRYVDLVGIALDYYFGLGVMAEPLKWIEENVFL